MVKAAVAAGRPYAVAFIDVRMPPGWDGIETTEKIWRESPDFQVVNATAYSDYPWSDFIQRLGVSDRLLILKKPFENVEVRQLATALTAKWNSGQRLKSDMADLERLVSERTRDLSAAKEALLKQLQDDPHQIGPSPLCTIAEAVDAITELLNPAMVASSAPDSPSVILVLDTDTASRHAICLSLANAGVRAIGAGDPSQALSLLADNVFDLIVADGAMGGDAV